MEIVETDSGACVIADGVVMTVDWDQLPDVVALDLYTVAIPARPPIQIRRACPGCTLLRAEIARLEAALAVIGTPRGTV